MNDPGIIVSQMFPKRRVPHAAFFQAELEEKIDTIHTCSIYEANASSSLA